MLPRLLSERVLASPGRDAPPILRQRGQADATGVGKEVGSMAKIGRSAASGRFIPVRVAQQQKNTSVVETIKVKKGK